MLHTLIFSSQLTYRHQKKYRCESETATGLKTNSNSKHSWSQ